MEKKKEKKLKVYLLRVERFWRAKFSGKICSPLYGESFFRFDASINKKEGHKERKIEINGLSCIQSMPKQNTLSGIV